MKILEFIIYHYKNIFIFPVWFLLFLFSLVYKLIILKKRKKGYKEKIDSVKLISIGNITTGGTGKTEFVIYLGKKLKSKTAVVLRGYAGKNKYKYKEVTKHSSPLEVGDESLLLKKKTGLPVFISPIRKYGILAAKKKYKVSTILLDDAFQHFKLDRDVNIVLIDYTNPFGNNYLIPAGILREPLESLKYADIIIITKYEEKFNSKYNKQQLEKIIKKYNSSVKIIYSTYEPSFNLKPYKNKKILIFSAIANPEYFLFLVKKYLSPEFLKSIFFKDHHSYTNSDIKKIFAVSEKNKIDYIFTTEKDIVKLKNYNNINVFKIKLKLLNRLNIL